MTFCQLAFIDTIEHRNETLHLSQLIYKVKDTQRLLLWYLIFMLFYWEVRKPSPLAAAFSGSCRQSDIQAVSDKHSSLCTLHSESLPIS
jgi:hypothetical protein